MISFWKTVFPRREVEHPLAYYSRDILECHERYIMKLRSNVAAPVELIYGKPVWNRTEDIVQNKLEAFSLWGSFEGEHYISNGNRPKNDVEWDLRRFLIAVWHPQVFTFPFAGKFWAPQDWLCSIAHKLVGIPYWENYYASLTNWQKSLDILPYSQLALHKDKEQAAHLALIALQE